MVPKKDLVSFESAHFEVETGSLTTSSGLKFRMIVAGLHLAASVFIGGSLAVLIFVMWFPGHYREMSGGTTLLVILASVDLILGPLVTLIVADHRKPKCNLVRDIFVVVTIQLAALSYGLHITYIARPVIIALEVDRFRVVSYNDVYMQEISLAPTQLRQLPLAGPRLVKSTLPSDPQEKSTALRLGLKGFDIGTRPSLWSLWDQNAKRDATSVSRPITTLFDRYPARQLELKTMSQRLGIDIMDLGFIPVITPRGDWIAIIDKRAGEIVDFGTFDGF